MQLFFQALCRDVLACVAGASDTVNLSQLQQHNGLTPLDHQASAPSCFDSLSFLIGTKVCTSKIAIGFTQEDTVAVGRLMGCTTQIDQSMRDCRAGCRCRAQHAICSAGAAAAAGCHQPHL